METGETFGKWFGDLVSHGLLCREYQSKVSHAGSNKQLIDLAMDANGMPYLCEMSSKGHKLSYSLIKARFAPFINGNYISTHTNKYGHPYTSAVYCDFSGKISGLKVTLVSLLGCNCRIDVCPYCVMRIYADNETDVSVHCPDTSKVYVEYWTGAKVGGEGNINFIKHG